MAVGVKIKPEVLRWAIEKSDKNVTDLREKFKNIEEGLEHSTQFSITQIDKLSRELHIPFGYFMLNEPPEEKIELLKYRTIENLENDKPSRDLVDTIKEMKLKQDFMKEILVEDGFSPLNFINSITIDTNVREAAQKIRDVLRLELDWNYKNKKTFSTLRKSVSDSGILVMQNGVVGNDTKRILDLSEFRAFVMIDEYVPLIFLNTKDSESGRTFSLCHELVHIWLGTDELYNANTFNNSQSSLEERYCNEVAAELLLPQEILAEKYGHNEKLIKDFVETLSNDYSISQLVVLLRMKNTKLLGNEEFKKLYHYFDDEIKNNLKKKKQGEKVDYYNVKLSRMDNKFIKTVDNKAKEGRILYSEAFELIGTKGDAFIHS